MAILFWNKITKHEGIISGFLLFFAGVLLEFQAYLDLHYKGSQLLQHTVQLAFNEMKLMQVKEFLGA
ncbi:hypothetical protein ACJBWC_10430, partial [Streptococcus suis]